MANSNIWKDYFTFTKGERISVFVMLSIILLSIVVPHFYKKSFDKPVVDTELQKALNNILQKDSASAADISSSNDFLQEAATSTEVQLFQFDPNTLDAEGFRRLGLRDKTINTIINYRNKGGYFKVADDVRKIYGLKTDEADRIIPYIRINNGNSRPIENYTANKTEAKTIINKIDINTATEEDFKALPGIGDVLSKRIIKFRNSINGFASVNDISRTYGLPDSTFQLILPYLTISESKE